MGAHYSPATKTVVIPIDSRAKASKWKAESIVYHEFGHASDWAFNMRSSKTVAVVMEKYRKEFRKDKSKKYKELDLSWKKEVQGAFKDKAKDKIEQIGAFSDTLMALNPNYGYGHAKKYYSGTGKKEAEFIAHAFENKFIGNEVFKKIAPDLYKDMIKMIDDLKPK